MADQQPIEVELARGARWTFKKSRAYVMAFERGSISDEDISKLTTKLLGPGVKNVICLFLDQVPEEAIKVFEMPIKTEESN